MDKPIRFLKPDRRITKKRNYNNGNSMSFSEAKPI